MNEYKIIKDHTNSIGIAERTAKVEKKEGETIFLSEADAGPLIDAGLIEALPEKKSGSEKPASK